MYKKIREYNADLVSSGYIYEEDYIAYNYVSLDEDIYENEDISYLRVIQSISLKSKRVCIKVEVY